MKYSFHLAIQLIFYYQKLAQCAMWYLSNAPSLSWTSICSSSNGNILFACASGTGIYKSSNYGIDWSIVYSTTSTWSGIACSAAVDYVYATVKDGSLYKSTDQGTTWSITSAGTKGWTSIATSSNGKYAYAGVWYDKVYYTSDYGVSWGNAAEFACFVSTATSSSGQYVVSSDNRYSCDVYTSNNYGASYSSNEYNSGSCGSSIVCEGKLKCTSWDVVVTSSSGQYIVAASDYGIATSLDYGSTWIQTYDSYNSFTSGASSSDYFFILTSNQGTLVSSDYGQTWSYSNYLSCAGVTVDSMVYFIAATCANSVYLNQVTPTATPTVLPTALPTVIPTATPRYRFLLRLHS